jgi:hypothetical protein
MTRYKERVGEIKRKGTIQWSELKKDREVAESMGFLAWLRTTNTHF